MTTGRQITLFAAGLALAAPAAHGQLDPADTPLSLGPAGGSAISVVANPADSNELLVIRYLDGLFRSTDGGDVFVPHGIGYTNDLQDLTLDPRDEHTLFARDEQQVRRSTDFGATWTALGLSASEDVKSIAVPTSGNTLLATDAFNVYRSADDGANWSAVYGVVPFGGMVLDSAHFAPSDPQVAYVNYNDGVLRSTDGGLTFSQSGPYDGWAQGLTVDPTNADVVIVGSFGGGVLRSVDGGATFVQVAAGLPGSSNPRWFRWAPDGSLWASTLTVLARSTDLGSSWTVEMDGIVPDSIIPATLEFAADGDAYLGAESNSLGSQAAGGVYYRANGETDWSHRAFLEEPIFAVAITEPGGQRLIGIGAGIYSGAQGEELVPTAYSVAGGNSTRALAVDPAGPDHWIVGGVGSFIDNSQIWVLDQAGAQATLVHERFGAGRTNVITRDPNDANNLLAGLYPAGFSNQAIVRSTDGGDTWTDMVGTEGWATVDIAFDRRNPGFVVQLSENNQWSWSTNGGASWAPLQPEWPSSGAATALAFDPFQDRLYRGDAGGGLWVSDDLNTWTNLNVPLHADSDILLHPDVPDLMWVGSSTGELLVSADGGQTFEPAWDAPLDAAPADLALDPADGSMLVGTTGASTWELPNASPYVNLGGGTTGSGGFAARQYPLGGLPRLGNSSWGITGDQLLGGATALLALGIADVEVPLWGGTLHVGSQVALLPAVASGAGAGDGSFTINVPLPSGPSLVGIGLISQFGAVDPGVADPSSFVLSNGLRTKLLP